MFLSDAEGFTEQCTTLLLLLLNINGYTKVVHYKLSVSQCDIALRSKVPTDLTGPATFPEPYNPQ